MKGDEEEEAPRPRPLSGGIWTLFSWLRRTERSSSSESVTSVGSDRTVASFDFLSPPNYKHTNTPLVLSQGPLTDTYKKRLYERNLRRHYDRDLTLCRKYGLYKEDKLGYDAFTLPSARRIQKDTVNRQNRDRRATSESIQRRSAFVPGKRRAPLPPILATSASLPRNYKRKRPAPQPPVKSEDNKENIEIVKAITMNSTSKSDNHIFLNSDVTQNKAETEKYSKQNHSTKEVKLRSDKGFLKQIFDNRKRNSAIDTSHIKLLPSISELDKQAAEIIEANKSIRSSEDENRSNVNTGIKLSSNTRIEETWICTTCLKKYKAAVQCCIYCIIKENSPGIRKNIKNVSTNSSNIYTQTENDALQANKKEVDEKKKLREMLKEMKDSLPKRPKHGVRHRDKSNDKIKSTETPTLRIGATVEESVKIILGAPAVAKTVSNSEHQSKNTKAARESFFSSQPSSSKQISLNVMPEKCSEINKKTSVPNTSNFNNIQVLNADIRKRKSFEVRNDKELESLLANSSSTNEDKINTSNNITRNILPSVNIPSLYTEIENKEKEPKEIIQAINNKSNEEQKLKLQKEDSRKDNLKASVAINQTNLPILQQNRKPESTTSETKNKIECIQLGNVFAANEIKNIDNKQKPTSVIKRSDDLHTPLKISSLLNPLYCPKSKAPNNNVSDYNFAKVLPIQATQIKPRQETQVVASPRRQDSCVPMITSPAINSKVSSTFKTQPKNGETTGTESSKTTDNNEDDNTISVTLNEASTSKSNEITTTANVKNNASSCLEILDQHARRRELINKLEQAISKGNEQIAAEAAAELAKLKLSCSVLSFSSQIVAEPPLNNISERTKTEQIKQNISPVQEDKEQNVIIKAINENLFSNTTNNTNLLSQDATPSTSKQIVDNEFITIEVLVEDKEAARGPIPLLISKKATLEELKRQAERSLGIEIRLQRWIIGKTLCTNDSTQLIALAGPNFNAPFYLCLVESDTNKDTKPQINNHTNTQIKADTNDTKDVVPGDVYSELMKLEQQPLVPNSEEFECGVCIEPCAIGAGVVLRECIHTFCRECLADVVRHCDEPVVACPAMGCPGAIQEREIRALLSAEEYERWLARGLAAAESGTRNTFHCRTRDCKGWAFCEPGVNKFPCPVCKHINCLPCQAVHEGVTCDQYQAKLRETVSAAESNENDEGTQALLKSLISRGEALECPECSAVITKKWGCDWIKCSACKTEICWVTKGRRWGPGGKGDTSAGCKCGVDGKRCHPSCGYCH